MVHTIASFLINQKKRDMNREPQTAPQSPPRLISIFGVDRTTHDLLAEWLTSAGFTVASGEPDLAAHGPAALAIVDIPFTRHGRPELIERVAAQYPGIKILAFSSTFFSNVSYCGNCARELGVDGVLPKPIARNALIATVRNLLEPKE
jgi:DNA-binding NarL/FixJ family response regulator